MQGGAKFTCGCQVLYFHSSPAYSNAVSCLLWARLTGEDVAPSPSGLEAGETWPIWGDNSRKSSGCFNQLYWNNQQ